MLNLNNKRKIIIGLFLIFSLIFLSMFAFTVTPSAKKESENFLVCHETIQPDIFIPDDYNTIQEGINNSSPGDIIFVGSGTYNENVVVNKEGLTLIGENKFTTTLDAGKKTKDAMELTSPNVKIQGFTFTNAINDSDLWDVSGLRINSSNVTVSENIFLSNRLGISVMTNSYDLTISNNSFINDGILLGHYTESESLSKKDFMHKINDNTVNDKPLYYYKNTEDFVVPDDGGQVILANCTNVTIKDMYISNTDFSIILGYCSECTIEDTEVIDTDGEVILLKSDNNIIQNNRLVNNLHGICLDYKSNHNIVRDNFASESFIGISALSSSSYNQIYGNTVRDNDAGIYLSMFCFPDQHDNVISENEIDNNIIGISIKDNSNENLIEENLISNNNFGIQLKDSPYNEINSNIFKKNLISALFLNCEKNFWNNNYWNRPRILPKLIFGYRTIGKLPVPWVNIDKNPKRSL